MNYWFRISLIVLLALYFSGCFNNDCKNIELLFPQSADIESVKGIEVYFLNQIDFVCDSDHQYTQEQIRQNSEFNIFKSLSSNNVNIEGDIIGSGTYSIFAFARDNDCYIRWSGCLTAQLPDNCNDNDALSIQMDNYSTIQECNQNEICSSGLCMTIDCIDNDGDQYGSGRDCIAYDCDDSSNSCTTDCETDIDQDNSRDCDDSCVDADRDGYGNGISCLSYDCDDSSNSCTTDCETDIDQDNSRDCDDSCVDADRDGYGNGIECYVDCDDNFQYCNEDCSDADGDSFRDCEICLNNPSKIGSFDTSNYNFYLLLNDNYAFLGSGDGLHIFDISKNTKIQEVGYYVTDYMADSFDLSNGYVYIYSSFENGRLRIIDVTDITEPSEITSYYSSDVIHDLKIEGNYAYMANTNSLRIIDISDKNNINEIGFYDIGLPDFKLLFVTIKNNNAYLMIPKNSGNGYYIKVIDITNSSNPVEIGSYSSNNTLNFGVKGVLRDNYLYFAEANYLTILDISNPDNIRKAGDYLISIENQIYLNNNYLFTIKDQSYDSYLYIFDVSNVSSLHLINSNLFTNGWISNLAVKDWYLYLAISSSFDFYSFFCQNQ